LEEAAGISRYKERRRETESRIAHTRENLDRLNDLREEVDKQIRHLQRQAATARRYQVLKEEQRKLQAELLALRLQGLDVEAGARDAAAQQCEHAMQAALAELRRAEAEIERLRSDQLSKVDTLNTIQGRFYEAGADAARIEQTIQHSRELRERQRIDLDQAQVQVQDLGGDILRDRGQIDELAGELSTMGPGLEQAHDAERTAEASLERAEAALASWQLAWDRHAQAAALGQGETQVERARIEQLENQQRRLLQQRERQAEERAALNELQPAAGLESLIAQEARARDAGRRTDQELAELLAELSAARESEREQTQYLNELRGRWQTALGSQVSTEALQQAALGKASGAVTQWLQSKSLDQKPRLAQTLRVERGWERAVETVLGSYLEAVCVDNLDGVAELLSSFDGGQLTVASASDAAAGAIDTASLQAKVQGPPMLTSVLSTVFAAASLAEALARRRGLRAGESVVTRDGVWIGRDWLRLSRDRNPHTGIIEREESLREIRAQVEGLAGEIREREQRLNITRERVREGEDRREQMQADVNRLHREHLDRRAELDAAEARTGEVARRLAQLETGLADVGHELERAEAELRAARGRMETAIDALAALEPVRLDLEQQRERLRGEFGAARSAAQAAQQSARELALQVESRRSAHASLLTALERAQRQLDGLAQRRDELAAQLSGGEGPLAALQAQLQEALVRRAAVDEELRAARIAAEEMDSLLREHDGRRLSIEQQVDDARRAMEEARLAAAQARARRESIAEQLAATRFEFDALTAALDPGATTAAWEAQLEETGGKLERLGQVNLAAIDEFKEQSERKEYLDRQYKDLTDALETLESAMRKIDRETRTRFQDTFDRVNAGLKEKFPRLFGGGHAYLELTGEDSAGAGVSVMARPPGKRNSTISQLSGGEKALTAVALVFAIFELNPAPFCLLDEVDAPLDENNVGRFCDIVRDMSSNVQFIFITHNRSTMELASHLVGVTMNEPGVSRLVAVDVDEAARMAAM
jgi:chromosome segregation protein